MTPLQVMVDQLVQLRGEAPPLVHSVRIRSPLTMRYWDYLAWAIERTRPGRFLLLGLGGGSVLQLLERRGVTPPCVAVELDAQVTSLLEQHGWLTYPRLEVRHDDARSFLGRSASTEQFDAIMIDVYSDQGYVQELYDAPLLRRLAARLTPHGVVLLHCLDPMMKFPSFRVVMPELPPSPSCTVARHLASLGMDVAVYPMWSTALVAASRDPRSLDWPPSAGSPGGRAAEAWSDQFFASRRMSIEVLERFVAPLDGEWSYANLARLDGRNTATLVKARSLTAGPAPASHDLEPVVVREVHAAGDHELTPITMQAGLALKGLLEQTKPGDPRGRPFVHAISEAARAGANPALCQVESFALAWLGELARAVAILRPGGPE